MYKTFLIFIGSFVILAIINLKLFRMKRIFYTLFTFILISCQTKTVEIEVASSGGKQLRGANKGKNFYFGEDKFAQAAIDLISAFAEKDVETMAKFMSDTVKYIPPQGGKAIESTLSELPKIVELLHEPYDSITRELHNAIPVKFEDSDVTLVTVSFYEKRYYKTGETEQVRLIDRIRFRDEKIFWIAQWMGEMK
jgi:hypothetical protein|tara:strand:- start:270 stop:854 length:585 start_codon:yes stop_codon:yes gene_type:complete